MDQADTKTRLWYLYVKRGTIVPRHMSLVASGKCLRVRSFRIRQTLRPGGGTYRSEGRADRYQGMWLPTASVSGPDH